jgi:hypothetical protein
MKAVCAWCEREGKPGYLGDREPSEDSGTTHGICPSHRAQVLEDFPVRSYPVMQLVATAHPKKLDLCERLVRRLVEALGLAGPNPQGGGL